ncbi:MAG: F0F1 ATP synthase subunit A, partial [Oscillospiraceae bacterium]|nr:F0F1 ATP synthase subunit A [Oscillospiraceae bacterium]
WLIMLFLILFAAAIRFAMRKWKQIPSGLQNIIELAVEMFDNMVRSAAGENYMVLGNWFFAVFALLLASNLSGILGLRPPTSDWSAVFAFALATFVLIQIFGIRYRGRKYLKRFLNPFNIIGELARPVSLSFRMFGNMLAGMILISLVYGLPIYLRFAIPSLLNAFFDLFTGALQTYIFCVLSLTYIGSAAEEM